LLRLGSSSKIIGLFLVTVSEVEQDRKIPNKSIAEIVK
jgi:hypothetical protein